MGKVVQLMQRESTPNLAAGPQTGAGDTPSAWIGSVISHYRILEQLGGGGMGVVYRAIDEHLDRSVALKFLPPEVSHLTEAKERFIQEAKAASALDHANICTIYEIGATDDGQLFIAMAYHPGETLKQRIAGGALSVAETVEVMRQIASGLAESHAHDIIHRDIKPANIWVCRNAPVQGTGQGGPGAIKCKILDFGLAKVTGKADLTRTGSSMGTPAYMSPEHARGERVDPRTDLWSLGVLSYEALTRQVPFTGGSIPAIMYSLLAREARPLRDLRPEVPPALERIVWRLMRKDASERYRSCHELLAELDRVPLPPTPSTSEVAADRVAADRVEADRVEAAVEAAVAVDVAPTPAPTPTPVPSSMTSPSPSPRPAPTASAPTRSVAALPLEILEALSPSPAIPDGKTQIMPRPPAVPERPPLRAVPPVAAETPRLAPMADDGFEEHLAKGLEAALSRSYERAVQAFEKALELRPGDPRAQFNLDRIRGRLEKRGS